RLLGCLFSSSLFADRTPPGHVLLTCFLGGRTAPELVQLDDAELVHIAADDVARTLGTRSEPAFTAVRKTQRAIPQYELGHQRFVDLAAELEAGLPGVHLAGNWLSGAGVADCVERGAAAAAAITAAR
ncbi:MAG TPA: protoporphyrinogen oxidase, partial [Thermoanaerobaculia bacterium]|nr:protoporphyrinogen oxidase [Thermoanaerobaculia bacterium]